MPMISVCNALGEELAVWNLPNVLLPKIVTWPDRHGQTPHFFTLDQTPAPPREQGDRVQLVRYIECEPPTEIGLL